ENLAVWLLECQGPASGPPARPSQVCQHYRNNAANALILGTLFNFWACHPEPVPSTLGVRVGGETRHSTMQSKQIPSKDFRRQMEGYGLTTAHILYRLPDHPLLLQTYVWQDYDLCPRFPALNRFLAFWLETLEGPLHSVTVAHSRLIKPAEIHAV